MKKKIFAAFMVAAMAVGVLFAFTACGGPADVVKNLIEGSAKFDAEKVVSCVYFADEDTKAELTAQLKTGFDQAKEALPGYSASVSSYSYEKTGVMTDAEIETLKLTLKDGDEVEETEKATVKYKLKVEMSGGGASIGGETDEKTVNVTLAKISGTWYIVGGMDDIVG